MFLLFESFKSADFRPADCVFQPFVFVKFGVLGVGQASVAIRAQQFADARLCNGRHRIVDNVFQRRQGRNEIDKFIVGAYMLYCHRIESFAHREDGLYPDLQSQVDALEQAGIPREKIILAYAGEPVPETA
jgi:hypothetical protein